MCEKVFNLVREHLISSQFFSKRNAFRNGGRGVALVSDGKSQIAHFPHKRKIDFEENFEVRIERKRPALSLLKPRQINSPRRSTVDEPSACKAACPAFA